MYKINHTVKVSCLKSGLSKMINLDKYTPFKARQIFDFYANHEEYLIEVV